MQKTRAILLCLLVAAGACSAPEKETSQVIENEESTMDVYYVGTYTNGDSKGIYKVLFDESTGIAGEVTLAAETSNPSFLAVSGQDFIYAVNEDVDDSENAEISAWQIQSDGTLERTDSISSEGSYACYITVSPTGEYVLAANYGGGSVISVPIESPGKFGGNSQLSSHSGSGPNEARQKGPHAHSVVLSPDNAFAYAADLGTDKVMIYRVMDDGVLLPGDPAFVDTTPGAGPRHIAWHPSGKFMYVVNELNGTVTLYNVDQDSGALTRIQEISTLPEDFTGVNYCADIHMHPSGDFLYASNRGHDSIVRFNISDMGAMSEPLFFSSDVDWPRNFMITGNGKYILIANERGNDIVVGAILPETGEISDTGTRIRVPSPVCIVPAG